MRIDVLNNPINGKIWKVPEFSVVLLVTSNRPVDIHIFRAGAARFRTITTNDHYSQSDSG